MDDGRDHSRHGHGYSSHSRAPETYVTTSGTRVINASDEGYGRSRHRRGSHSHSHAPQIITTSGSQVYPSSAVNGTVINANGTVIGSHGGRGTTVLGGHDGHGTTIIGGHGHGGATVINADAPRERRRRRRRKSDRDRRDYFDINHPSTIHGLWNKFLGSITGNSRRKRHGDREVRRARQVRQAMRIAGKVQDAQAHGYRNKLKKRFSFHRRRHHDRDHAPQVVVAQDTGNGRRPWMHHHRAPGPHTGRWDIFMGTITGNRERRSVGRALLAATQEHRRAEKRRRRDDMSDMARRYRERGRWFA
ncbi:hypothetical protein M422DRAFT_62936 [Sphaerobolus stellatus SS14]|nr:hypothetical protein M422DRAFT_62936 [Sphaerobolus stellatus SS14]